LFVDSSVTRTQSRGSALPPAGSHGRVETNASLLSFQTASVGRASSASTIVGGAPGCFGGGGKAKPATTLVAVRSISPTEILPVAAFPVYSWYRTSSFAISEITKIDADVAGVCSAGRRAKAPAPETGW
jgi:hypothetical protein